MLAGRFKPIVLFLPVIGFALACSSGNSAVDIDATVEAKVEEKLSSLAATPKTELVVTATSVPQITPTFIPTSVQTSIPQPSPRPRKLLPTPSPKVNAVGLKIDSGDMSLIAYSSTAADDVHQIFVLKPNGTGHTQLTFDSKTKIFPKWSPDKSTILYLANHSDSIDLAEAEWQIHVMDDDGSNKTQLTTGSSKFWPVWSPDGHLIAFYSDLDDDGSFEELQVMFVSSKEIISLMPAIPTMVSWSPTNKRRILFTCMRDGPPDFQMEGGPDFNMQLCLGDLVDFTVDQVTNAGMSQFGIYSPDGSKILLSSVRESIDAKAQLFMMDADGTNEQQITFGGYDITQMNWSPDGRKIVYVEEGQIRVVSTDLSERYSVTGVGWNDSPVWSPDSQKLAFRCFWGFPGADGYDTYQICLADSPSQNEKDEFTNLTAEGDNVHPDW